MSILDAYESPEHQSNVAHFATIVKLASVDGPINTEEEAVLKRFAFKLDVSDEDAKLILKNLDEYPLIPPYTLEERTERLHDLFNIIYADNEIDDKERELVFKYAIGLGFSSDRAAKEIEKCIRAFGGDTELED
jgi:uncharacterized tellurite resistance protein B-like protein